MLIVGPNQDFQWMKQNSTEEVSGAKLITRNCLEKQLVVNLPLGAHGWAG